jgi:hypothetical protein
VARRASRRTRCSGTSSCPAAPTASRHPPSTRATRRAAALALRSGDKKAQLVTSSNFHLQVWDSSDILKRARKGSLDEADLTQRAVLRLLWSYDSRVPLGPPLPPSVLSATALYQRGILSGLGSQWCWDDSGQTRQAEASQAQAASATNGPSSAAAAPSSSTAHNHLGTDRATAAAGSPVVSGVVRPRVSPEQLRRLVLAGRWNRHASGGAEDERVYAYAPGPGVTGVAFNRDGVDLMI